MRKSYSEGEARNLARQSIKAGIKEAGILKDIITLEKKLKSKNRDLDYMIKYDNKMAKIFNSFSNEGKKRYRKIMKEENKKIMKQWKSLDQKIRQL